MDTLMRAAGIATGGRARPPGMRRFLGISGAGIDVLGTKKPTRQAHRRADPPVGRKPKTESVSSVRAR
jgi:hypothetical protein